MALATGTKIGPYEITGPLGAGGMGEVYRARDARLDRDVAIKVLPEALREDRERLARFEREARATGQLAHPNLIAVLDVGVRDGAPYLVTELLEGQTLRDRLAIGPIPWRRTTEYAVQIARGLAAAHDKGIVHRDLKPANIFITVDDHVKILDFGLAKTAAMPSSPSRPAEGDQSTLTASGALLGTPGYMAPEQITGDAVDPRADLFAFGAVLYQMLTATKPFSGESPVHLAYAVLRDDPAPLAEGLAPPALARIVRRCLERRPERRFQSAADLAFHLEALLDLGASTTISSAVPPPRRLAAPIAIAVLGAAAAIGLGVCWRRAPAPPPVPAAPDPVFHRVTYAHGLSPSTARFAADGASVFYTASRLSPRSVSVMSSSIDQPSMQEVAPDLSLADVSVHGELALLDHDGTLYRLVPGAGSPRAIADHVIAASWTPDGETLAVTRMTGGDCVLELPLGTTLARTHAGVFSRVAVSPDGARVAIEDHADRVTTNGSIAIVDRAGRRTEVAGPYTTLYGLAWSPDGAEVWFSAVARGNVEQSAIWSAAPGRTPRARLRAPRMLELDDLDARGRLLIGAIAARVDLRAGTRGDPAGRDLGWLDANTVAGITDDGRRVAFLVGSGTGETADGVAIYVRGLDGAPPVLVGHGFRASITGDGAHVVALVGSPLRLELIPTGPGPTVTLPRGDASYDTSDSPTAAHDGSAAAFVADGTLWLSRPDAPPRALARGVATLEHPFSVDGAWIAAVTTRGAIVRVPTAGGDPVPVAGAAPGERPIAFSADGAALFVVTSDRVPASITRIELAGGRREPWMEITPPLPTGPHHLIVRLTPDGATFAFSYLIIDADLFVVTGLGGAESR